MNYALIGIFTSTHALYVRVHPSHILLAPKLANGACRQVGSCHGIHTATFPKNSVWWRNASVPAILVVSPYGNFDNFSFSGNVMSVFCLCTTLNPKHSLTHAVNIGSLKFWTSGTRRQVVMRLRVTSPWRCLEPLPSAGIEKSSFNSQPVMIYRLLPQRSEDVCTKAYWSPYGWNWAVASQLKLYKRTGRDRIQYASASYHSPSLLHMTQKTLASSSAFLYGNVSRIKKDYKQYK